jgi:hypothetical protein
VALQFGLKRNKVAALKSENISRPEILKSALDAGSGSNCTATVLYSSSLKKDLTHILPFSGLVVGSGSLKKAAFCQ